MTIPEFILIVTSATVAMFLLNEHNNIPAFILIGGIAISLVAIIYHDIVKE